MRLGSFECSIEPGSLAHKLYGQKTIQERHRHRWEFNDDYRELFTSGGMKLSGINPQRSLVEIVEIPSHPFFIGVQYHPEFKSAPLACQPIFKGFVAAALAHAKNGGRGRVREVEHA